MTHTITPARAPKPGLNRREWLGYAWLATLGLLALKIAGVSFDLALPRLRSGEFCGIIPLGSAADLPVAGDPPVNYPEGKFWLVRTGSGLLALYKVCTHLDCLFNWDDQEGKFVCPCHGSLFDREGRYLTGPAPRSLDRFVIQALSPDGLLLAETDGQSGAPLPVVAAAEPEAAAEEAEPAGQPLQAGLVGPAAGPGEQVDPAESANPAAAPLTVAPETLIQVDTGRRIIGSSG